MNEHNLDATDTAILLAPAGAREPVADALHRLSWLEAGESVRRITRAGEGNMNLTLRVETDARSLIVKQARPWVEKYPQIEAPADRALRERDFYRYTVDMPAVAEAMPHLLAADEDGRLLMLEDLGAAADSTSVYHGQAFTEQELRRIGRLAGALHRQTHGTADMAMANRAMRQLNHQHIFVVPWRRDGAATFGIDLDELTPGLYDAAERLRQRTHLRQCAHELGKRYLADGPCLLHGDLFPGSLLRTERGLYLIDPEFCHFGEPTFDLGVWLAHLAMAKRPVNEAHSFLNAYHTEWPDAPLDPALLAGFAGAEVIRRLIGVAQLPLPQEDTHRIALLWAAADTIEHSEWEKLFK
jgi:5-methylthioribose kinase